MSTLKSKVSVAKFIEQQIAVCGKSQKEIASELGYSNANIITMFKNGATKLPIDKAGKLAKALGVDPMFFLRLVMSEYVPETWEVIESIMGANAMVGPQEVKLLEFIRQAGEGTLIDITDGEAQTALKPVLTEIVKRQDAKTAASVARYNSMPPNNRFGS